MYKVIFTWSTTTRLGGGRHFTSI